MKRVTIAALALAGIACLAATAYWLGNQRETRQVAVPPDDASPEHVVEAYLDALDGHDCDTARAVVLKGQWNHFKGWCDDVANLNDVRVSTHFRERPSWSGRPPRRQVANVPVRFDLDWRLFHDDASIGGPTTWGYLLVRDASTEPWRITSQGVG